jgi:hypothetical protein
MGSIRSFEIGGCALDFRRPEVYDAGTSVLTLLAYPGSDSESDPRRGALHRSLCALALQQGRDREPGRAEDRQAIRPVDAYCHSRQIARLCRSLLRQILIRFV